MNFNWKKRWSFADKWYCNNFVISKITSPSDSWHLEELYDNGQTKKHYGNYSQFDAARYIAESEMKKRGIFNG